MSTCTTPVTQLPISKIRTDGGTQLRERTDQATVDDYAEALEAGAVFPPVTVFRDSKGVNWLASGFHRLAAHVQVGRKTIDAHVRQGELRAAILFAIGENKRHGLRRTNNDKRKAVFALLRDDEWSAWSGRQIAEHCGVSEGLVRILRFELAAPLLHPEDDDSEDDSEGSENSGVQTSGAHGAQLSDIRQVDGEGGNMDDVTIEDALANLLEAQRLLETCTRDTSRARAAIERAIELLGG